MFYIVWGRDDQIIDNLIEDFDGPSGQYAIVVVEFAIK